MSEIVPIVITDLEEISSDSTVTDVSQSDQSHLYINDSQHKNIFQCTQNIFRCIYV